LRITSFDCFFLVPQKFFVPNKQNSESNFESYLLLTPLTPTDNQKEDKKLNLNDLNLFPSSSSKSFDNDEICSTPKTFIETPPNFHFDDYHFNQSIKLTEKVISKKKRSS